MSLTAQVGEEAPITNLGTIENDGGATFATLEFCLDENDDLIVKVEVILGYLEIMGEEPDYYGVIPSPDLVPEMQVEFTIGEDIYIVPLGNFDIIELENGNIAFSYIAQSPPINFSAECDETTEDMPYVETFISYRLVTPNLDTPEDDWIVYPACDYADTYEMFSCSIYSYASWCDAVAQGFSGPTDPNPTCYDEWFSGGYLARMYCNCNEDPGPTHDEDRATDGGDELWGGNGDADIKNRFVEEQKISAYPNPMGNSVQIESNNKTIESVKLYNSRGVLMISKTYKSANNQKVRLNTSDLPKGLYLIKVETHTGFEFVKVLK